MSQNQVKSLLIGELISLSIAGAHKIGKVATFDLTSGKVEGEEVSNVRTVHGPTTPQGLLLVEIKTRKGSHFKIELDVVPSDKTFSVLMYNVGPEHKVSIPGLKCPLMLTGPAFILVGSDVFSYDGTREVTAHHGYIVESCPLMVFMVGRNAMLQNKYKRRSIKLPSSVADKEALILAYVNLVNNVGSDVNVYHDSANDVMASFKVVPSSNL